MWTTPPRTAYSGQSSKHLSQERRHISTNPPSQPYHTISRPMFKISKYIPHVNNSTTTRTVFRVYNVYHKEHGTTSKKSFSKSISSMTPLTRNSYTTPRYVEDAIDPIDQWSTTFLAGVRTYIPQTLSLIRTRVHTLNKTSTKYM